MAEAGKIGKRSSSQHFPSTPCNNEQTVTELMTNNLINLPSLIAFADQHQQKRMPQILCDTKHKNPRDCSFYVLIPHQPLTRVYQQL